MALAPPDIPEEFNLIFTTCHTTKSTWLPSGKCREQRASSNSIEFFLYEQRFFLDEQPWPSINIMISFYNP